MLLSALHNSSSRTFTAVSKALDTLHRCNTVLDTLALTMTVSSALPSSAEVMTSHFSPYSIGLVPTTKIQNYVTGAES